VGLVQIAAQANAPEESLRLIHQFLSIPARDTMTLDCLQHDPASDPTPRGSRFQALLASSAAGEKGGAR
jgi:hypothetical protein